MLTNIARHEEKIYEDSKNRLKIIKSFSELFNLAIHPITDDKLKSIQKINIVDSKVICCAVSKTDFGLSILRLFKEDESKKISIPNFEIEREKGGSGIALDYLTKVINIVKNFDDHAYIETRKDYLIKIETKDFQFLIAPRVEN